MSKTTYLDFTGKLYDYQDKGELTIAHPWYPVWLDRGPDVQGGYLHRPEYYRESGITYAGKPTQAVSTRYATHSGGVITGPFDIKEGTRVTFTMYAMMQTYIPNRGEGRFFTFVTEGARFGAYEYEPENIGEEYTDIYDTWLESKVTWISRGKPIYLGGWSTWKYRSSLCLTLYGMGEMDRIPQIVEKDTLVIKEWELDNYSMELVLRILAK